ncbi:MAG TPA: TAT-variant-translocated molybdopterin oxidoreductase [Fimbriimonas sp.]|nr:TAT-variant-translocated molybdopterin oxidoreductase [Fimbriimonas sp.]
MIEERDEIQRGPEPGIAMEQVRQKLAGKKGRNYWRSLEELADTPEMQKFIDDEFPNRSTLNQINRRDMLKFMGASMALAGLTGCRGYFMPQDKVVPYVKAPEEMVPGIPLFYASSVMLGAYATGVLVEQHEGRPTRLEGNPLHPASLGALDAISQAEVLNLYDPDRAMSVILHDDISTWDLFTAEMREVLAKQAATQGAGIRVLTNGFSSPTTLEQVQKFFKKYPAAKWHAYEPVGRSAVYEGARMAFGRPLEPVYDFTKAKTVLSLDADFLQPAYMPGSLRYARDFANGRRVEGLSGTMNRLYCVESTPSLTGAMADHKWPVKASQIYSLALVLASALGVGGTGGSVEGISQAHLQAMVEDLRANSGVVVCGDFQPPHVHALVHSINQALGANGTIVRFIDPVDATVGRARSLKELTDDLNGGGVEMLLIVGGNPVYDAPADFDFASAIDKAKTKVYHTLYENETSAHCDWILPMTHCLEEWSDGVAYNGQVSMVQPLIAPLYEGRSMAELFASLIGNQRGSYDLVRDYWKRNGLGGANFEKNWRTVIHDGLIDRPVITISGTPSLNAASLPTPEASSGWELIFRPDPNIYDGRYSNNGWLQELPKPMTKMTWDNVVMISPADAVEMGLDTDRVVKISLNGKSVEAGVFVQPGHPRKAATIHFGYGRTRGGVVATVTGDDGGGFDAYQFRKSDAPFFAQGLSIEPVGSAQVHLATTQIHQPIPAKDRRPALEGSEIAQFEGDHREIILEWPLAEYLADGEKMLEERKERTRDEFDRNQLYPDTIFDWKGEQWAMTIDLNTCIGCNACVTACQSENNIPVVGKKQVGRHREMHWLRIDRYYSGDEANPTITHQPLACVHCEKAPCEPVCPVAATVHSQEGLNQMIYNRCVGTRYCSNNCPYKVRRFNYLNFSDNQLQFATWADANRKETNKEAAANTIDRDRRPLLRMINNPDVTVRGRGVMEKCTYCVQRINNARIEAKKANRQIAEGDILTACQQACPTQTIVFGDQTDKNSRVSKLRNDPRAYLLLEELNTRPRTSYLAKLRNPNPAIETAHTSEAAH